MVQKRKPKSKVKVLGSYTEFCPDGRCFDQYDGDHEAWVFMENAYVDLGTWWCVTPFVGVGIGSAWTRSTNFSDVGYVTGPGTTWMPRAASRSSSTGSVPGNSTTSADQPRISRAFSTPTVPPARTPSGWWRTS